MASNLLWAHLLRKDATAATEPSSQLPPIAPQDRTGTSMRMLIHDTQVNLEKFSARLDGLLQRVEECRAQVVNANKLLDVERDKVLTELLGIASRCQSELKAHIGTPAQAPVLDLVHLAQASTEKSVQALEKRIDALQALFQTHVHAMQSIQDQQNTLIGIVLPLVPILHGVSPQMDQIRVALSDAVANAVSTMTNSIENVRSTLVTEFTRGRAESSTWISKQMSASQRKRSNASVPGFRETNVPTRSPLDNRGRGGPQPNLKRARVDGPTNQAGCAQFPRKLSRLAAPLANPGHPPSFLRTPRTPRRPLADLLIPHDSITPRTRHHVTPTSRGHMRPELAAAGPSIIPTSVSERPLERVYANLDDLPVGRGRSEVHHMSFAGDRPIALPSGVRPSDQDTPLKAIKIEETLEANLSGVFTVDSSPLSSPPSSLPFSRRQDPKVTNTTVARPQDSRLQGNIVDTVQAEHAQPPPPLSDPFSNATGSPPKSMSLRDRRAQISRIGRTETRRFIPLVPWSDEEE